MKKVTVVDVIATLAIAASKLSLELNLPRVDNGDVPICPLLAIDADPICWGLNNK